VQSASVTPRARTFSRRSPIAPYGHPPRYVVAPRQPVLFVLVVRDCPTRPPLKDSPNDRHVPSPILLWSSPASSEVTPPSASRSRPASTSAPRACSVAQDQSRQPPRALVWLASRSSAAARPRGIAEWRARGGDRGATACAFTTLPSSAVPRGASAGSESLVRWSNPTRLLHPADFLPDA